MVHLYIIAEELNTQTFAAGAYIAGVSILIWCLLFSLIMRRAINKLVQ